MTQQLKSKQIYQVAHQIGTMFNPQKVILFGSWAWGSPNQDSDVDLCVVAQSKDTRALARKIDVSLFPRLFPLDIVVLTPDQVKQRTIMNDFFVTDIMTKGTVLYGQS